MHFSALDISSSRVVGRPKEPKSEPLFCCGELHKSANYHKRTVHQKYTKIYFKHHPDASFLLKRNPKTCLFHCPQCDKGWAMATPVRNHIFQRCEGYVTYRSPISGTMNNPLEGDDQATQVKDEEVDPALAMDGKAEEAAEETQDQKEEDAVNASPVADPEHSTPDVASHDSPTTTTPKLLPSPSTPSNSSSSPSEPSASATTSLFPLLRPAQWSPINITNGLGIHTSTLGSRPSVPSLLPSLAGGLSSRSSIFSLRTWPDDQPPGVPVPSPRFKVEDDSHMIDSVSASGLASGSRSGFELSALPFGPRLRHAIDLDRDRAPSAARVFLDGLRRPLGHAARHVHALGVVSEADLDLICTMPDAWDELGELLTKSGVTVIEWLMVKEAFKARAREMSAVV